METVKATEVGICIFTPKVYPAGASYESNYPEEERRIWQAFAPVLVQLRAKHGDGVPVFMDFCPLTNPQNQLVVAEHGIPELPAVQVFARYSDGTIAQYILTKDFGDKFTGVNWTTGDVRPFVEAVLYRRRSAEPSLLCRIFPPLCNLGKWAWLAAATYTTYQTSRARNVGQIAWGTAAGFTWNEFFRRGGFQDLLNSGE